MAEPPSKPKRGSKVHVNLAGEFYTLAQLTMRDLVATLTLGNTKGVDVLVSNERNGRLFRVEVKTTTNPSVNSGVFGRCYEWFMNEKHGGIEDPDLIYVFVLIHDPTALPRFFVVPAKEVAAYIRWEHEEWKNSPPSPRRSDREIPLRMFRVPAEGKSDWESAWHLFEASGD